MNASLEADYTTTQPNHGFLDPIQFLPLVLTRKSTHISSETDYLEQPWLLRDNNNKVYVHSIGIGKSVSLLMCICLTQILGLCSLVTFYSSHLFSRPFYFKCVTMHWICIQPSCFLASDCAHSKQIIKKQPNFDFGRRSKKCS